MDAGMEATCIEAGPPTSSCPQSPSHRQTCEKVRAIIFENPLLDGLSSCPNTLVDTES